MSHMPLGASQTSHELCVNDSDPGATHARVVCTGVRDPLPVRVLDKNLHRTSPGEESNHAARPRERSDSSHRWSMQRRRSVVHHSYRVELCRSCELGYVLFACTLRCTRSERFLSPTTQDSSHSRSAPVDSNAS